MSSLLGYLFTTVTRNAQTMLPKAAPMQNQPFSEKWVNFGKYRIRPDATQTASRFPPLAVKRNETTLFRKPLNINELRSSETALGLPSSHRQIADFRKHADFWESRQPDQYIVYWTHRGKIKHVQTMCSHNTPLTVFRTLRTACTTGTIPLLVNTERYMSHREI